MATSKKKRTSGKAQSSARTAQKPAKKKPASKQTTCKKKTPKRASTPVKKGTTAAPKQTTALSTVAKVSDFSGMHSVTVTEKKITVNGKKRFPHTRQNAEVAARELQKRGVKSVTYRV